MTFSESLPELLITSIEQSRRVAVFSVFGLLAIYLGVMIFLYWKFGNSFYMTWFVAPIGFVIWVLISYEGFFNSYKKKYINEIVINFAESLGNGISYEPKLKFSNVELALTRFFVALPPNSNNFTTDDCIQYKNASCLIKCFEIECSGGSCPIDREYVKVYHNGKPDYDWVKLGFDDLLDGLLSVNELSYAIKIPSDYYLVIVPKSESYSLDNDVLEIEPDSSKTHITYYLKRKSWPPKHSDAVEERNRLDDPSVCPSTKIIIERREKEIIKTPDTRMSELYTIYSNNSELSGKLVTPELIDEIVKLHDQLGREVFCSLSGGKLYLGTRRSSVEKLFEPPFLKPIDQSIANKISSEFSIFKLIINSSCQISNVIKSNLVKNNY